MRYWAPILLCSFILVLGIREEPNAAEEGIRIDEISIEGNEHIADGRLKGVMYTRESRWWNKARFSMDLFRDDLHSVTAYYNNHGYLDARVASWDTTHLESNRLRITIRINEGPQSVIDSLKFSGNTILTDRDLQKMVTLARGDPFSQQKMIDSNWKIVNAYAERGFLDARVQPNIEIAGIQVRLTYQINEGLPTYIDTFQIAGNQKTKDRVILRELEIQRGDLLTRSRLVQSRRNLYRTGLFNSVSIQVGGDTLQRKYRPVHLRVDEAKSGEFNFGIGYGSRELVRLSAEIRQGNLNGTGQQLGLRTKFSFREIEIEGAYSVPYFLLPGMELDNTIYYRQETEDIYVLNRVGGEIELGKRFTDISRISTTLKVENNYFATYDLRAVKDTIDSRLRTLRLTFTRDTRENLFNATTGSFFQWKAEMTGGFLAGTDRFIRSVIDYTRFLPATDWVHFAFQHKTGIIELYGNQTEIPVYERFYAGGDQSIRGFEDRAVSPRIDGKSVGGQMISILRGEARIPVYKDFHAALFLDTGNVWEQVEQFNTGDFRTGTGFGIRYNSPLGVIRADLGFKLFPEPNEDKYNIHLTVGQAL